MYSFLGYADRTMFQSLLALVQIFCHLKVHRPKCLVAAFPATCQRARRNHKTDKIASRLPSSKLLCMQISVPSNVSFNSNLPVSCGHGKAPHKTSQVQSSFKASFAWCHIILRLGRHLLSWPTAPIIVLGMLCRVQTQVEASLVYHMYIKVAATT